MDDALRRLATLWVGHPARPRLDPKVMCHWDALLKNWSEDLRLPLFIRKRGAGALYSERIEHSPTGQELVLTDNSPAHWTF